MPDQSGSAMMQPNDQRWMEAAIRIGAGALGTTWPNPAVGALLVKDGLVVAAARTAAGGRPHAEQQVLAQAGPAAAGATLYVTLEPCAHHGKTPPCADALIAAGIGRVVIGAEDPDERVHGKGAAALKGAGIAVSRAAQAQAGRSHCGHMARIRQGRPWITLKLAISDDGMIGRKGAGQVAITGEHALRHVHALRARNDAVLVGSGTAEADDPRLTCRLPGLEHRSPVRIVLDTRGRIGPEAKMFADGDGAAAIRIVGDGSTGRRASAFGAHVRTIVSPERQGRVDLQATLAELAVCGLTRILVEGGSQVASALIAEGLVDEALLFHSPVEIGKGGIPALTGMTLAVFDDDRFRTIDRRRFGDDRMIRYFKAN